MQTQDIQGFDKNENTFLEYYGEPSESFKDDRYGKIKILQNKYNSNDQLMIKEIKSRHLYQCEKDLFQVKERYNMNHTNLLEMTSYTYGKVKGNSGKRYYLVSGFYEYNKNSLDKLIEQQKRNGQKFENNFLLQLFEDILKVIVFLQQNERLHGDIRPKYIFYDENKTIFKLSDRLGDPRQPNQIQLSYLKKDKSIYMSPTIFDVLIHKKTCLKHNPYKSEVFSLGMVVLECGLLRSIQDIYDKNNKQINFDKMIEYLEEFILNYPKNEVLLEILQACLELSPKLRKDPKAMLKNLYKQKYSATKHYTIDEEVEDELMIQEEDELDREFEEEERRLKQKNNQNQLNDSEENLLDQQNNINEIDIDDSNMDYEFDELNNYNSNLLQNKHNQEKIDQLDGVKEQKQFELDINQINRQQQNQDDIYQQHAQSSKRYEQDSQVSIEQKIDQYQEDQNQKQEEIIIEKQSDFEQKLRMFNRNQEQNSFDNQEQSEISCLQDVESNNQVSDNNQQDEFTNQNDLQQDQQYRINVDEIVPEDQTYFNSTVNQGYFHQVESDQSSQDDDQNEQDNNSQKTLENKYDKAQTQFRQIDTDLNKDQQNYTDINFQQKNTQELDQQNIKDTQEFQINSEKENSENSDQQQLNIQQNDNQIDKQFSVTINGQVSEQYLTQQELKQQQEDQGPNQNDINILAKNVYEEPIQPLDFEHIQNKQILNTKFKPVEKVKLPDILQTLSNNHQHVFKLDNTNSLQFNTEHNNFINLSNINFQSGLVKELNIPCYDKIDQTDQDQQDLEQTKKKETLENLLKNQEKLQSDSQRISVDQMNQNQKYVRPSQAKEIRKKHFKISNDNEYNIPISQRSSYNQDSYSQFQNNNNANIYTYQNDKIASQLNPKILISQYEQKIPSMNLQQHFEKEPLNYNSYQDYKIQKTSYESRRTNPEVRIRQKKRSKEKSQQKEIIGYQSYYPNLNNEQKIHSIDDIPIRLENNHSEVPITQFIEKNSVKKTNYLNVNNNIKERTSKTTGRIVSTNSQQIYNLENKNLLKNISSNNLYENQTRYEQGTLSSNPNNQQSLQYLQKRQIPGSHRVISLRQKLDNSQSFHNRNDYQKNFEQNPFYTNEYTTPNINSVRRVTYDPKIDSNNNLSYEKINISQQKPVKVVDYTQKVGFISQRVIPQNQQYQFSQNISHIIKDSKEVINNSGKVVRRIKLQQLIIIIQWQKFQ